jgi:hypothetical protein
MKKYNDSSEDIDNIDPNNYKGIFYNAGVKDTHYVDPNNGAHFSFGHMCALLNQLKAQREKQQKNTLAMPNKKLRLCFFNQLYCYNIENRKNHPTANSPEIQTSMPSHSKASAQEPTAHYSPRQPKSLSQTHSCKRPTRSILLKDS